MRIERRIDASLARRPYSVHSRWVPLTQIPQNLQHAVIAAEDGGFYSHRGVDWEELHMAIDDWRTEGKPLRGASTLTQQLVKNLFLSTRRSHVRKLVEWTLAPWAERILSKERILEIYLNIVEWGPGVWGAAAAAEFHYGAPLDSLSRGQAARLAGSPAPRRALAYPGPHEPILRRHPRSHGRSRLVAPGASGHRIATRSLAGAVVL